MLLHIGYHKTATSWLQDFVFSEPQLGFVQPWDRHAAIRSIALAAPFSFEPEAVRRELDSEESRGDREDGLVPVLSHERFSGIPYTGGHDSELILDRLRAVFPEARVLITVREQRDMIWSAYRQYVLDGGRESPRRWLRAPKSGFGMATRFDIDFYMYDRLVNAYRAKFGADRVLVLPFELLTTDQVEYVERVAEFAGAPITSVGREKLGSMPLSNVSMGRPATALKRFLNAFLRTWLNPEGPLDVHDLNYYVGRALSRVERPLTPKRSRSSVPPVIADAISDRYEASNRALSEMTGLDLGEYGYAR